MMSSPAPRVRKHPEERRAEIVSEAASIALAEGLERVTLRAVADGLGVRPGLISHYFPAAEDLVAAAFVRAVSDEREDLFPDLADPIERMACLISRVEGAPELTQLWLNARHLCRFSPALREALRHQEQLGHLRLTLLIEDGVARGAFKVGEPGAAGTRILVAIDGAGTYINYVGAAEGEMLTSFVTEVAEWTLGLPPGELRAAVERHRRG